MFLLLLLPLPLLLLLLLLRVSMSCGTDGCCRWKLRKMMQRCLPLI
jgi:hypothetical protein